MRLNRTLQQSLLCSAMLIISLFCTSCCLSLERRKIGRRRYSICLPPKRPSDGYRILVFLHGQGGSEHQAHNLWSEYGPKRGYIVAGPAAKGKTWSSGGEDVKFVKKLIKELQTQYDVPRARTFLVGHSAGALACYFYALPNPQNQYAFCAVNGFCPTQFLPMLQRKEKVDILLITGEKERNRPSVEQGASLLRKAGYLVHSAVVKGAGHGYNRTRYNSIIIDWFEGRIAQLGAGPE